MKGGTEERVSLVLRMSKTGFLSQNTAMCFEVYTTLISC